MKWDYRLEPPDDLDKEEEFDDQEPDDDFYDDALADAAEDQWMKKRNL